MSTIKANTLTVKCGSTLTLGESGKTIAIASGASTTGMGRTGTVDWQTSSIKTANFTATNGEGYFVNTTSGSFEIDLPAGTAGDIVAFKDYANTWDSNNLLIDPNGSQKIGGGTAGDTLTLATKGGAVTLVYADDTNGWQAVYDTTSVYLGQSFFTATGGTITCCGNFKVHTFTSPGTFTVTSVSSSAPENTVAYQVIAGGGGGGKNDGGGGGAGGYREGENAPVDNYSASPLATTGLTLTATAFPIAVGSGGAKAPNTSTNGSDGGDSTLSSITSTGGGGGASETGPRVGSNGGSGGGGGAGGGTAGNGGAGNTPPVSPPQGQNGGNGGIGSPSSNRRAGGGGGGAGGTGNNGGTNADAGNAGAGVTSSITFSAVSVAGGGGGGGRCSGGTSGQGGGAGGTSTGSNGTANTGGGGGGSGETGSNDPGNGGSGKVVIRYKYQ